MNKKPPKYPLRFFRWFCHPDYVEEIEGDLLERFEKRTNENKSARWLFTVDVLKLFRLRLIRSFEASIKLNYYGMFKHNLLICFRSLKRNKAFTFLNVFGLAVGIASCLVILQYVTFESSYDQFHSRKNEVYRVDTEFFKNNVKSGISNRSSHQLGPTILDKIPGVEAITRTHILEGGAVVTYKKNQTNALSQFREEEGKLYFVDQDFFDLFDYKLLIGDRKNLLIAPNSIVITKAMWQKYLPNVDNPIGAFLTIDGGRKPGIYQITGILETLPENTHYSFGFLMPIHDLLKGDQYVTSDGWGWNNFTTFIMLKQGADIEGVSKKAINIRNERKKDDDTNFRADITFTSLNDLHLRDKTKKGGVSEETLSFFTIIAIFIIIIAWLNYVNLATAQAMRRAKEVGIRKSIGALKNQLVFQFLTEAFIINFIALSIAFLFAYNSIPILSGIVGKSIVFGKDILIQQWLVFIAIFSLGTFLSGFYPAIVLSSFRPAVVIKGVSTSKRGKFGLRQILVTTQLVIGVFLISGTYTVHRQLQFMMDEDLGLNVDQVVTIKTPMVYEDKEKMKGQMKLFREKITTIPQVSQVSISDAIPGGGFNWGTEMIVDGEQISEERSIQMMMVDDQFLETYEIALVMGRFHNKELLAEEHQIVVNETLVKKFDLGTPEEAIGKRLRTGNTTLPIIGVVKDYHWNSLRQEKKSTILYYSDSGDNISVRFTSENASETMKIIGEDYRAFFPDNPFNYQFMDEYFGQQYESDKRFGQIFTAFSLIAILIACLGLFGLASFTIGLRIKEIGIRKVLGARISSILLLIYKDYFILIIAASFIGIPVVYYVLKQWLREYAYRISISLDLFILPIMILSIITLLTVGYQSLKAARINPVESIKDE